MSCELKRNNEEEASPIKYKHYDLERTEDLSADIQNNSPSFRNRRNYLRYRFNKT